MITEKKSKQFKKIEDGLNQLGILVTTDQIGKLNQYLELLNKWNKSFNLTRISADKQISRIILESAALLTLEIVAKTRTSSPWMDAGTGAGIPGVILGVLNPERSIDLIDSRQKKIDFVKVIKRKLNQSNIHPIHGNLKNLKTVIDSKYEVIYSRAVGALSMITELLEPYITKDGVIVSPRGGHVDQEWLLFNKSNRSQWVHRIRFLKVPYEKDPISVIELRRDSL